MSATIVGILKDWSEIEICLGKISDDVDPTLKELIALENLYDYIDIPFAYRNKTVIFSDDLKQKITARLKYVIEYFTANFINKDEHLSYIFDTYFKNTTSERAYRNIWPTPSVLWTTHYPGLLEYTINWIETYKSADVLSTSIFDLFYKMDDFTHYWIYLLFGLTRQSLANHQPIIIDARGPRTDLTEVAFAPPDFKFIQKQRSFSITELNVLYIPYTTTMTRSMQILTCQLNFQDERLLQKKIFLYNRSSNPSTVYQNEHIKNADVSRSLNQSKLVYNFPTFQTEGKRQIYKPLKLFRYELPIESL